MTYNNGDADEGNFKEKKKHGRGVYNWADGDYYEG
mgnify:CR=1 FL=1